MKTLDGRILRTGNAAEREAIEHLTAQGYRVYKRGWPDFLAVKENAPPRFVEVKPKHSRKLSRHQDRIAIELQKLGLVVEIFAPPEVPGSTEG